MNKKIAIYSSILNAISVLAFAASMLIGNAYSDYMASIFIAFGFVPMMCAYCHYSKPERKLAGYIAMVFSTIYAVFIFAVYYAQITTVAQEALEGQALHMLDYQQFGLFFNYDLFGYAILSLAAFFAGLTIEARSRSDKALKTILLIQGVFFISSFLIPLLGLFSTEMQGAEWVGTAVLIFWCSYFIPIGVLSAVHFNNKQLGVDIS